MRINPLVLGLASLVGIAFGQQCANPLFSNLHVTATGQIINANGVVASGSMTIDIQGLTPADFPADAKICSAFAGQKSCCTANTLASIQRASDLLLNGTEAIKQRFAIEMAKTQQQMQQFQATCPLLGLDAATCSSLQTSVNTIVDNVKKLGEDTLNCASALEAYSVGMMCFACSTDFNKYINTGAMTVNINSNTCTKLVDTCAPINTDYIAMMKAVTDMANKLTGTVLGLGAVGGLLNANNLPDMCGGTISSPGQCSDFICKNFAAGASASLRVPEHTAKRARMMLEEMNSASSLHIAGQKVSNVVQSEIQDAEARRSLASDYSNTYSSSGYDAIAVGCKDQSSSVCKGTNVAAIVGGVIGVIVVIALVGGFIVYRRKRQAGGRRL